MRTEILTASFDKSANLTKAEYDPFMKVLSLTFKNGGVYDYVDVEENIFHEMILAESVGRYFHSKIRGHYDYLKKTVESQKTLEIVEDVSKKEKGKKK